MVEAAGTAPASSLHPSSFTESFFIYIIIITHLHVKVNINSSESELYPKIESYLSNHNKGRSRCQ